MAEHNQNGPSLPSFRLLVVEDMTINAVDPMPKASAYLRLVKGAVGE
jgi:hypothetical protein